MQLSDSLGVTGSRVFFGPGWVPYDERGAMFAECDLGISLHQDSVETRFSFRTRVLDYLWAGLPVLTTDGDSMAELVKRDRLGLVVPVGDVEAVKAALVKLSTDDTSRAQMSRRSLRASQQFQWPLVAAPLMDYCDHPFEAPDRTRQRRVTTTAPGQAAEGSDDPTLSGLPEVLRLGRRTLQTVSRPRVLLSKGREYVRRRSRGSAV